MAALNFILQPGSLSSVQVSAATEAVAAAGSYSALYYSYNNLIANALDSGSIIDVQAIVGSDTAESVYYPSIGDITFINSPNASPNINGSAPAPPNSGAGPSFQTGIMDALAVNLTGQPVTTITESGSPAYFDVGSDGTLSQTGWITPGEGVLINDPGGSLTSIRASDLVSSFSALGSLDITHAGFLDASDPGWANLRVWVDTSGAADFQQGSAYSLDQLGISSIDLHPVTVNATSTSNQVYQTDSLAVGGHVGAIAQVGLTYMMPFMSGL